MMLRRSTVLSVAALLALVGGAAPAFADSYLYQETSNPWGTGTLGWTQSLGRDAPADPNNQIACGSRIGPSLGYYFQIDSFGSGCTPTLGFPTGHNNQGWVLVDGGTTSSYYTKQGCQDIPADFPRPSYYVPSNVNGGGYIIQNNALPGSYHWALAGGDKNLGWQPPSKWMGYAHISAPRQEGWQLTVSLVHPFGEFPWLPAATQEGTLYLMKGNYTIRYKNPAFNATYTISVPGNNQTNEYTITNDGNSHVALVPGTSNATVTPIPATELPTSSDVSSSSSGTTGGTTYTGPPGDDDNWWTRMFVPSQAKLDELTTSWNRLSTYGPIGYVSQLKSAWDAAWLTRTCGPYTDMCGAVIPVGGWSMFGEGDGYTLVPVQSIDLRPELTDGTHYSDGKVGSPFGTFLRYARVVAGWLVYVGFVVLILRWIKPQQVG